MDDKLKNKNFIQLYTDGYGLPALCTLLKEKSLAFNILMYFLYHMDLKNTVTHPLTQEDIGKVFHVKKQSVSVALKYLCDWHFIWLFSYSRKTNYYVINPNLFFKSYMFNKKSIPVLVDQSYLLSLSPYQMVKPDNLVRNLYFEKTKELFSMNKIQLDTYKHSKDIYYKPHTGRATYQNSNFTQLYKQALPALVTLTQESSVATRILLYLVAKMDNYNSTDVLTLSEIGLACSSNLNQVSTSLKILLKHNFIYRYAYSSKLNCYVVNPQVFFKSAAPTKEKLLTDYQKFHSLPYEAPSSQEDNLYLQNKKLFKLNLLDLHHL
ncbi:replication/maintenance protein RepL [Ligilactobacillus agilis]